jgi:hypothetical protein
MNKTQLSIIVAICGCMILAHFYHLSTYLINFPNWGDDFLFLAYFTDLPSFNFMEFGRRTTEFHSYIHRFPMARLITAVYSIFQTEFNFKTLTILANLSTLTIIYPLTKLIQRNQVNPWHLVALVGLLFAPNGNMDNFALIGVLQHTTSLVYLIWISYWISDPKSRSWGIWFALLYPMFSTEGLAFIPCIVLLLIYLRDSRVWIFSIAGLFVFYVYFLGYASPATIPSSGSLVEKLLFTVKGTIVFVGGAVKKDLIISMIIGTIFMLNTLYILWKYHQTKNGAFLFSGLILLQIMAVGAMITLGRGNAQAGDLGALFSERFSTYGLIFILISYFAAIQPNLYKLKFSRIWLLIPAMVWIGLSTVLAKPKLENLHTRLIADASNAYYFNTNTVYRFEEREINLLKKSGNYTFPKEIVSLSSIRENAQSMILTQLPEYEAGISEYGIAREGILLVEQSNKPWLFLPINSLSHSIKIKKDIPFDQKMSRFVWIPTNKLAD